MQSKSITGLVGPALMLWLVFQFATTPTILYAQVSEQPTVAKLVYEKRGSHWLIVEQHVSAMPEKKAI